MTAPDPRPQRHKWIDDGDGNCEVCGQEGGGSDADRDEEDAP